MPWIHVTLPPENSDGALISAAVVQQWTLDCAAKAARLLGLNASDVIVIVSRAEAISSPGALVTIRGRPRSAPAEAALATLLQDGVAEMTGMSPDSISLVRFH